MTAPTDAVLSEEEWERDFKLNISSPSIELSLAIQAEKRLRAHDAALRAKLAERDRLLARCADYLGGKRITMTDRNALHADIRAALEGGPRDG